MSLIALDEGTYNVVDSVSVDKQSAAMRQGRTILHGTCSTHLEVPNATVLLLSLSSRETLNASILSSIFLI